MQHRHPLPNLSRILRSLLCALTLVPCVGADVLVVDDDPGPGVDHGTLELAIAAAGDGDTIVLRSGVYRGFSVVAKDLVVTADAGATVEIRGSIAVWNVDEPRSFVLHGVVVRTDEPRTALEVQDSSGPVWIQDCEIHGFGRPSPAGFVSRHAVEALRSRLVIEGSTLVGGDGQADAEPLGGVGLSLGVSLGIVHDSTLRGGEGHRPVADPFGDMAGATVSGGRLEAWDSTFVGGDGADGAAAPCTDGGRGGAGIALLGHVSTGTVRGSTAVGGGGGSAAPPCVAGASGPAVFELGASLATRSRAPSLLSSKGPVPAGGSFELTYEGQQGDLVFLLLSGAAEPSFLGSSRVAGIPVETSYLLPALGGHAVVSVGPAVTPAPGQPARVTWTAPAPALVGATLFAQALVLRTFGSLEFVLSACQAVPLVP